VVERRRNVRAYLQHADGDELELRVTTPDPPDGTFVVHFDEELYITPPEQWWIRIVP
jgi:hypothetical protein